jgi:uncharacterized cupredoxin-like copper-binding protein
MPKRIQLGLAILVAAMIATACRVGGQSAITVTEKEYSIQFANSTVKAGRVKLIIKNDGKLKHNFVIMGAGVRAEDIQPGTSREITADLKPGKYIVLCNIESHIGMVTTLTVTEEPRSERSLLAGRKSSPEL